MVSTFQKSNPKRETETKNREKQKPKTKKNIMKTQIPLDQFNEILNRTHIANEIKSFLTRFPEIKEDINQKKGIYLYGASGVGKTQFAIHLVKEMGFDPILYDAGDLRNKAFMTSIASQHLSTKNVIQLFRNQPKKIVLIMDEIDGLNRNDQGGISALTKLIRHKKMKKQKKENSSAHPIICISNYYTDKKIRELMKVCYTYELKEPTLQQKAHLLNHFCPLLRPPTSNIPHTHPDTTETHTQTIRDSILYYVQGDIRKLAFISSLVTEEGMRKYIESDGKEPPPFLSIFKTKNYNDDVKEITRDLLVKPYRFEDHNEIMNDTDRTTIALLYHENVVDVLSEYPSCQSIPFYLKLLDNICFSDYMYRITFQNQIWQFNEMCSIIKTMYNNFLYHQWASKPNTILDAKEIRFTKILTKYNTEYGNMIFLFLLCEEMGMDKKDVFAFFQEMRLFFTSARVTNQPGKGGNQYDTPAIISEMEKVFESQCNISKLEIRRMYRFLDQLNYAEGNVTHGRDGLNGDEYEMEKEFSEEEEEEDED